MLDDFLRTQFHFTPKERKYTKTLISHSGSHACLLGIPAYLRPDLGMEDAVFLITEALELCCGWSDVWISEGAKSTSRREAPDRSFIGHRSLSTVLKSSVKQYFVFERQGEPPGINFH